MSGTICAAPGSNLAITFSAEAYTSDSQRMFVRALVDGQLTNPSDVVFAVGGWTGTHAFSSSKKTWPRDRTP